MLDAATDFPLPGSFTFIERNGRHFPVRIIRTSGAGGAHGMRATVSGGPKGASGTSTVDLYQLPDPTPLSEREVAELEGLKKAFRNAPPKQREAMLPRIDALTRRHNDAEILASLMQRRRRR